jgi:hypothetical protein
MTAHVEMKVVGVSGTVERKKELVLRLPSVAEGDYR